MGSFSELVLSFDFRSDTPPDVLAAFSALGRPFPDGAFGGPAPALPKPVQELDDLWCPDWRDAGIEDAHADEPWRHDWAPWLSGNFMSISIQPHAALTWTPTGRWNLSCRAGFKTWADSVFEFLEWLGPFVHVGDDDFPDEDVRRFVGNIMYEGDERPNLIWAERGALVREDLNR